MHRNALLKIDAVHEQAVAEQGFEVRAAGNQGDVRASARQHAAEETSHCARAHDGDSLHDFSLSTSLFAQRVLHRRMESLC